VNACLEPGCPEQGRRRGLDVHAGATYLRRLARAHAAGELATDTFRRQRRAYIEACAACVVPQADDATVPRFVLATGPGQPGAGKRPKPVRWRSLRRLLGLPLSVVLLVILVTDGPA
jgi:hypothetical protein